MKFEFYNPSNKSIGCVVRTFTKLLNRDFNSVKEELNNFAKSLNYDNYNEIEVFEKYLENNNYQKIILEAEVLVRDLKLDNGKYAIFCYDKADYYHLLPIINNIVYDKKETSLNLCVISVYKLSVK